MSVVTRWRDLASEAQAAYHLLMEGKTLPATTSHEVRRRLAGIGFTEAAVLDPREAARVARLRRLGAGEDETKVKLRRVRTPGGAERYGQAINSVIVRDPIPVPHGAARVPTDEEITALFSGWFAGGHLSTGVNYIRRRDNGSIQVGGRIRFHPDANQPGHWMSGNFVRAFFPGERLVMHEELKVGASEQRRGFATEWIAHCEKAYYALGYRQIGVVAGDRAGPIVWAKAGYRFRSGRTKDVLEDTIVSELRAVADGAGYWDRSKPSANTGYADKTTASPEEAARIHRFLDGLETRETLPLPMDVFDLGPGATDVMMTYGWQGYKMIHPQAKAYGDDDGIMYLHVLPAPAHEVKAVIRHVRTPGGREKYGEQIGEVIHPDAPVPHVQITPALALSARAHELVKGDRVRHPKTGAVVTVVKVAEPKGYEGKPYLYFKDDAGKAGLVRIPSFAHELERALVGAPQPPEVRPALPDELTLMDVETPPPLTELLSPDVAAEAMKTIKRTAITLDSVKQLENEGPSDASVRLESAKTAYVLALGARLGYTRDETSEAMVWLWAALGDWTSNGGLDAQRIEMHDAVEYLLEGGVPTTRQQRGMLLQKAWMNATWDVKYAKDPTQVIPISRFVQNTYAMRLELAISSRDDWEIESWPLTSWSVESAADAVQRRWVGRDTYAARLDTEVGRGDVWFLLWSEPALRTNGLVAPGEVIPYGKRLTPRNTKITMVNVPIGAGRQQGDLTPTGARVRATILDAGRRYPDATPGEVATATLMLTSALNDDLRELVGLPTWYRGKGIPGPVHFDDSNELPRPDVPAGEQVGQREELLRRYGPDTMVRVLIGGSPRPLVRLGDTPEGGYTTYVAPDTPAWTDAEGWQRFETALGRVRVTGIRDDRLSLLHSEIRRGDWEIDALAMMDAGWMRNAYVGQPEAAEYHQQTQAIVNEHAQRLATMAELSGLDGETAKRLVRERHERELAFWRARPDDGTYDSRSYGWTKLRRAAA